MAHDSTSAIAYRSMAASNSAAVVGNASSSLSLSVTKKYDVFISFRGEDTRGDFTSHLHAALGRSSIETYIDYRIQKGEEVWVELVKAIKGSTLFLVIFSENYANSSWCLNELVELMECRKQEEEVHVIPVFYKIDPSQVRKQTGSYRAAVANQKWKDALYEAANLSGFHSHTYRCALIYIMVLLLITKL